MSKAHFTSAGYGLLLALPLFRWFSFSGGLVALGRGARGLDDRALFDPHLRWALLEGAHRMSKGRDLGSEAADLGISRADLKPQPNDDHQRGHGKRDATHRSSSAH
jgi:hypothetical protein